MTTGRPNQVVNRSAWIRQQDLNTSPEDLIAKAKKQGIDINASLIYQVRHAEKNRANYGAVRVGPQSHLIALPGNDTTQSPKEPSGHLQECVDAVLDAYTTAKQDGSNLPTSLRLALENLRLCKS